MSHVPTRTMYHWNQRGKRSVREHPTALREPVKYSFGNGELFDEMGELVSKFTEHQRGLAMATGFGAFVEVKLSVRFDQQFCSWLMSRFDHRSRSITLASGVNLRLFPEDVTKVFGIPHGGLVPWHYSLDKSAKTVNEIKRKIGIVDGDGSCSVAAEKYLRHCTSVGVAGDDEAFQIAFIVYVMGILVDAKRPSHWESSNYLPALKNVHQASTFDWASCVLDDLVCMCLQVQADTKKKLPPCPSAGCLLLLNVYSLLYNLPFVLPHH